MRSVGIRELKNRLSEYLRRVRAGEEVLVTDRGEVVAELRLPRAKVRDGGLDPSLEAAVARGTISRAEANRTKNRYSLGTAPTAQPWNTQGSEPPG